MRARRASIVLLLAVLLAPCRASTTCETAPRTPRDRRLRPESSLLAVAAFNARWLFDGVDEPSTSPYVEDVSGARAHVDAVRDVVREVNADVVVLLENENCDTLARAASGRAGEYATRMIPGTDSATRQQAGLATKIDPFEDLRRTSGRGRYDARTSGCGYEGARESGVSKHFWTRMKVKGRDVSLVGAHLKANPTEARSCAQREAQVDVLRALVRERYESGDAVIVVGDLNDYSDANADADGNAPTSRVLAKLRDFDDDGVDELEEVGGYVPRERRYTWQSQNGARKAKLDYILTSKSDVVIVNATIRHDLVSSAVSDHFPLVAFVDVLQTRNVSLLGRVPTNATEGMSARRVFIAVAFIVASSRYFRM